MRLSLGSHFECGEVEGPKAYEVRCGYRYLKNLEDGDLNWWPEYAFILIDERTGYLTVESGFGSFIYGWPSYARSESLHSFLYDLDFDYFMGKASKQPYRIVDLDKTVASLKQEVINDRRVQSISKDQARALWNELLEALDGRNPEQFVSELYRSSQWSERLDYCDPTVKVDHPGMLRFWNEIWKPFAEAILKPHVAQQNASAKVAA